MPRTDMTAVSSDDTISAVLDLADEKGFSRLPVFGDGIDDIVGVCLVKDLVAPSVRVAAIARSSR